ELPFMAFGNDGLALEPLTDGVYGHFSMDDQTVGRRFRFWGDVAEVRYPARAHRESIMLPMQFPPLPCSGLTFVMATVTMNRRLVFILRLFPLFVQAGQRIWLLEDGRYFDAADPDHRRAKYLEVPFVHEGERYRIVLRYPDGQLALEGQSLTPEF